MTLHQKLVAANATLDFHESDLYVKADSTALEILQESGMIHSFFFDNGQELWIDVPFMNDDFWKGKVS